MAEPEPVPVRDLEVADRIARAVRGGRPGRPHADRSSSSSPPSARPSPRADARRRAARALALAGVAAVPDLLEAAPGQRLALEVRHVRRRGALRRSACWRWSRSSPPRSRRPPQLDFGDDNAAAEPARGHHDDRPADGHHTVTQEHDVDATTTGDRTTAADDGAAPRAPSGAARRARRAERARRAPRRRRAEAKAARAARQAARHRAPRRASRPTFLCVEGDGKELFNGTLSGARTFRGASCASTSASAPARA